MNRRRRRGGFSIALAFLVIAIVRLLLGNALLRHYGMQL